MRDLCPVDGADPRPPRALHARVAPDSFGDANFVRIGARAVAQNATALCM